MSLLDDLKWRYAVKKLDSTKKVQASDLEKIKESIQLAPTSYGLQLFKVLVIEDAETKKKLKPVSWNQEQITQSSHLLVFCRLANCSESHVDDYISLKAKISQIPEENLKGYGDFMKLTLQNMNSEQAKVWMDKQVYIALSNAMIMCAHLKVDSCPMEGFSSEEYDKILNLSSQGLTSTVILPIGYRDEADKNKDIPKVRKPIDSLFIS